MTKASVPLLTVLPKKPHLAVWNSLALIYHCNDSSPTETLILHHWPISNYLINVFTLMALGVSDHFTKFMISNLSTYSSSVLHHRDWPIHLVFDHTYSNDSSFSLATFNVSILIPPYFLNVSFSLLLLSSFLVFFFFDILSNPDKSTLHASTKILCNRYLCMWSIHHFFLLRLFSFSSIVNLIHISFKEVFLTAHK